MLVSFEGTDYEFDLEGMSVTEALYIKRQKKLTPKGLLQGLEELDPEALQALYWLMLKQNGTVQDIHKLPDFPLFKFGSALLDAMDAEAPDDDEEADPTEAEPAASQA